MKSTNEDRKQTFLYNEREYQFRIQASSLRKMERETGKRAEDINLGSTEGKYTILFYCTCWKEESVTLDRFLLDCRIGRVKFRPGAREYTSVGLYRLFASKIREFIRHGDL